MFSISINKIIKLLIGADFLFMTGSGFVAPVLAIFLVQSIEGGSATLAGSAVAIYWITKSVFRVPLAYYLDKTRGEKDDFYTMLVGFFLFTAAHFLYLLANVPLHIYLIQILMGVGGALAFTPWYGFFARHIDRYHENFEWSVEVSLVGFGVAGAGFAAGAIVDAYGFAPLFVISGILSLIGTFLAYFVGKNIEPDGVEYRSTPPEEKTRRI